MRDLRIAHVSDTHLGYRASAVPGRDEDFARSWIAACRAIVDSKPDLIVHAGDVFHHPHPSWGAVGSFIQGLYLLRDSSIPTFMISGNHDSSRLTQKHTVFSVLRDMFPDITIANDDTPILIPVDNLWVDIVLLPHRSLLNRLLSARLVEITDSLDRSRYSVLVAHGDVRKGTFGENNELGSIAIPELVFDHPWSYIALGHLHAAQPFTQTGWYSGSIERCGWSDYPADPAWTTVYLSKTEPLRHHQNSLPHRTFRQLETIRCTDVSDVDIRDEIMRLIRWEKLRDEPTIVRIVLDDITGRRVRFLERSIVEMVRAEYPKVVVQLAPKAEKTFHEKIERQTRHERMGTIEEMFKEFVASRTYPRSELSEFVLDKGLAVLRAGQDEVVQADTGDERSVPVG